MAYIPNHEDITGSDLTGSDAEKERTYTLSNSGSVSEQFSVIIEGTSLQYGVDYNMTNNILTFLNKVYDTQNITLDYIVWG